MLRCLPKSVQRSRPRLCWPSDKVWPVSQVCKPRPCQGESYDRVRASRRRQDADR